MFKKIIKLINVKSIVTIILTSVFSILSATGKISADQFLVIFTTVIAFYFGTQHEKVSNDYDNNNQENGG